MPAAAAYRLWARTYEGETAVSALEDRVAGSIVPDLVGKRLLDVGCGTGRRLPSHGSGVALSVGVDLVPEMLRAGRRPEGGHPLCAGDVRQLPFATGAFDVVWCRLVLGHLEELRAAYQELTRVSRPASHLVMSDFHPEAVRAGHTRTFRDADGVVHEIEHHVHELADHEAAACEFGWVKTATVEAAAGDPERPFYSRAGRLQQMQREAGLPLVLVLCFRR